MYKQEFYFAELGNSLNHAEIKFLCICINFLKKGGGGDCATTVQLIARIAVSSVERKISASSLFIDHNGLNDVNYI